tara:strand:- start:241 stop:1191 length:951 start_codon:yes stop_codon:yes gene_type:complete
MYNKSMAAPKLVNPFELYREFFDNFTSIHTRSSYQSDLTKFIDWLAINAKDVKGFDDLERKHVIAYRNFLSDAPSSLAPKTVARKLACISSYCDFLVEKGVCHFNPASSVKRPRLEVVSPTQALDAGQVRELFSAIDMNSKSGPMHMALLITFFTTGLRKSEVLNLRYKDYREINDSKVFEFKGKGGKIGQKLIHPLCIEALEHYLSWMRSQNRELSPNDPIFQPTRNPSDPSKLNKPLNPRTVNEIVDFYAKKIGLNFKISPHSARATFIGELLDHGVDIYTVAREVSHSSVKTTQEYDKRRKKLQDSPVFKLKF